MHGESPTLRDLRLELEQRKAEHERGLAIQGEGIRSYWHARLKREQEQCLVHKQGLRRVLKKMHLDRDQQRKEKGELQRALGGVQKQRDELQQHNQKLSQQLKEASAKLQEHRDSRCFWRNRYGEQLEMSWELRRRLSVLRGRVTLEEKLLQQLR